MIIKTQQADIPCYIKQEGEFMSEHTNKSLRWMEVSFQVSGSDVFNEIRKNKIIKTISEDGEEFNWKVKELSHSYTQGKSDYQLLWDLSEIESLTLEKLLIGNLELKPYYYNEEFKNNCLFITALVKLTTDEFEKLKSIYFGDIYFPVIRQGINEEPKDMRFGKCIWSKNEEIVKFKIYLVDKNLDNEDESKLGLFEPELSNLKNMLVVNMEKLGNLLKVLEKKNLLTSEEIEQIKEISDEDYNVRFLHFSQVVDIDAFS
ncbi:MAG: hypothetical protein K1X72_25680 [Pyrinomonadaceae bacterium]|nr:hypothetical protein [Pyrinomonadaceae bacterium]